MIKYARILFGISIALLITTACLIAYFETRPKLLIAENFKTADGNLEIFVKLPVDLAIEENAFSLVEKKASKVKLVFLELEGGNPEVIQELIRHENGDITFGPEKEVDLNSEILDNIFGEIKDFYWVQSNHGLEFTEYQFLGKFVREDLSESNVNSLACELIKSEQSRIAQEENEYVDIIVVIDDSDIHLYYSGGNYGTCLRDDWNLIIMASVKGFAHNTITRTLIHEIGHSSFIIEASDWYNRPTPEYYSERPFITLVDYDLYGSDIYGRCPLHLFTAVNKVVLAGLEYTIITGTPPYERTITLVPTSELTASDTVYKVPLEFVSRFGIEPWLRSYVFDLRNDVEGGQGVYIQEIVEEITSSFDHIYIKPCWSTIIPRKTIDDPEMDLITIPLYLSNRTQANDGRVTSISDEFVDVALDEEWDENLLRYATIRVKVKKQDLSPPIYKSKIYLTEFNGIRIAYVKNDGFAIRPVVLERNGRVSFYPRIVGDDPNKEVIWVFTPLEASIKHSSDLNLVDQKYRFIPMPEGVIEKLNQDFDLNLTSETPPVTGEDVAMRGFIPINVFIKEELEGPIIGFVYFDPMSESFKGIFADQ